MPRKQSRDQAITRDLVDRTCQVHSGRVWVNIRPTREMVGLKFGELVKTRRSRPYTKKAPVRGKKK